MAFLCGIDITGTQSLFGSPETLARSLVKHVKAIGITARVTVSGNFLTAVCLARGLSSSAVVRVVPPGEEATALAPLPIAVLNPTQTQAETFALWGIHTLGMLAALPEKELIAGYFLIVWDIVQFCKQHDILIQGRGSAANSAVCYALEITAIDPVGMELLF